MGKIVTNGGPQIHLQKAPQLSKEWGEGQEKAGKNPIEIIRATSFPSEGIEFAIRRSKFSGRRWLMRLEASVFAGGKPGMLAYPPTAEARKTDGWLELRFQ